MYGKIISFSTAIILASCLIEGNIYSSWASNIDSKISEVHNSYQIAQARSYRVRLGDTLGGIANRFGMSLNQILNYNSHLRSRPNLIYVGENINLGGNSPPSKTQDKYTVRPGDTLGGIAIRHGLSLKTILTHNPQIDDPNIIQVNQKINLGSAPIIVPPVARTEAQEEQELAFKNMPSERRFGSDNEGGKRGPDEACTEAGKNMKAIAPANGLGYTFDDYPYFFWYFPGVESDSVPILFTLMDRQTREINGKIRTRATKIYEKELNLDKSGIIAFPLPSESEPLQEGQEYKWRIEIRCTDKTAMFLKYSIKRKSTDNPELISKLENAPVDRHPLIYAESGVWFDALKIIALQLEQAPSDPILEQRWKKVLAEIKFDDLIGQPIQYIGSNLE